MSVFSILRPILARFGLYLVDRQTFKKANLIHKAEQLLWTTQLFAPRHYPIRLVTGDNFWFYKGDRIVGFTGMADNGWRENGSYIKGGMPDKAVLLPDAVQLTWLAETERKFYQAQIPLPREQILKLFNKELTVFKFGEKQTGHYNRIDFAFEPNGCVHLRVSGLNTQTIATHQAKQIPMAWWYFARAERFDSSWMTQEQYFETRFLQLPADIQHRYKSQQIPQNRWLGYHTTTYPWKLLIKSVELEGYHIRLANADYYWVEPSTLAQEQERTKQIPTELVINYIDNGIRYRHSLYLTDYDGGLQHNEHPDGVEPLAQLFAEFFDKLSYAQTAILQIGKTYDMEGVISNKHESSKPTQVAKNDFVARLTDGQRLVNIPIYRQQRIQLDDAEY